MVVYLAGKYSGTDYCDIDANINEVRKWAIRMWNDGFTVLAAHLNSAHFDLLCDPAKVPYEEFLIRTCELLSKCDVVFLVPGWEQSNGARLEKVYAERAGIRMTADYDELRGWLYTSESFSVKYKEFVYAIN